MFVRSCLHTCMPTFVLPFIRSFIVLAKEVQISEVETPTSKHLLNTKLWMDLQNDNVSNNILSSLSFLNPTRTLEKNTQNVVSFIPGPSYGLISQICETSTV